MNEIWQKILLISGISIGGMTLGGIAIAIITAILKGAFARAIAKIDVEKVEERAVKRGLSQLKNIVLTHDIQPLVDSRLDKIEVKMLERVDEHYKKIEERQDKIVNIFEKFYAYFEDSMVSDDKKNAMKEAIEDAKRNDMAVQSVVIEETIETEEKSIVAPVEAVKTRVKLER